MRLRWAILGFWILAALLVSSFLPTIREAQVGSLGDLVPNQADAIDAELRSKELFAFPLLSRTLVVQRSADGLSAREQVRVVERAAALNQRDDRTARSIAGAIPVTNALGRPPFSRERSTTALTYLFFQPEVDRHSRIRLGRRLTRRIESQGFTGLTGAVPARARQAEVVEDTLPKVELATLLLVALVVGLHFRSPGAPLAALGAVAAAYLISVRVIAWLGEMLEISVPSETQPVIVVLLFGVITDYSIFFLSAFRTRLAEGADKHEAAQRATARLLPIIVTAGLTVAAASGALLVAELGFFQAFGPGMAMAILVALAVATTLIPAALAIGGRAIFWPRAPTQEPRALPRLGLARLSRAALRAASGRPVLVTLGCSVLLLGAASGLLRLDLGNPLVRGLPADAEERRAYGQAARGFAPGVLSPTVIVVAREELAARRPALARLQRLLGRQPGVAEVVGPRDQPFASRLGAAVARSGDAARFFLVLGNDPLGGNAIADLRRLERRLPHLLAEAGIPGARTFVAGDTALAAETIDKTMSDLKRIGPAVALAVFLVLAVFLRALVAPLYLLAASILALLASLGVATYILGDLRGYGEMTYFVPVAAGVLLIALGSDYNIFLAGRVWQEARRRPLREAVAVAGADAARPIAVAGVVLAGSFTLLALVPIRSFRELALTMGIGLLLDAFVVRTLLVPALMVLIGERGGWPGRRLRRQAAVASPPA